MIISRGHLCLLTLATPDLSRLPVRIQIASRTICSNSMTLSSGTAPSSQTCAVSSSPLLGLNLASADTRGLTRQLLNLGDLSSCWLIDFSCDSAGVPRGMCSITLSGVGCTTSHQAQGERRALLLYDTHSATCRACGETGSICGAIERNTGQKLTHSCKPQN